MRDDQLLWQCEGKGGRIGLEEVQRASKLVLISQFPYILKHRENVLITRILNFVLFSQTRALGDTDSENKEHLLCQLLRQNILQTPLLWKAVNCTIKVE